MEIKNNQLTIDIPKGMEIDIENSDFTKGVIKFRYKYITYNDIENKKKWWEDEEFLTKMQEENVMFKLYGKDKTIKLLGEFETFEECDKAIEEFKTIENELFKNNEITHIVKEAE